MNNKLMPWHYSLPEQWKAVGAGVSATVVAVVSTPGFKLDKDGLKAVVAGVITYLVTFYLKNKKTN
jgi:hypothetical protein